MKKITIEVDRATDGQVKTLLADLAIQMEPWQRYIKYKIKNGNTTYKRQAFRMSVKDYGLKKKRQAPSDKLDRSSILG
tara:strand:- start:428 stop:661 length:234 start_codon:yes stop_codon:yes gene_type:complete